MADALISPAVGVTAWAATGATAAYCANKVRVEEDQAKAPLMGVLGAFTFAAQMVNFSIPGTGSSGHLGGGLLLAILLGPRAGFLVIASVLTVQALFFADGGLLALGANIFNLGFFPAFVAYPLVYKRIVGDRMTRRRIFTGSVLAALVGLGLGAFGVVVETTLSGITELPFAQFFGLVMPIHVAIALVEGLVTAAIVLFVHQMQPELLSRNVEDRQLRGLRLGRVLISLAVGALVLGGLVSWFASADPDGLEWSIEKVTGSPQLAEDATVGIHGTLAAIQERTSFLPDYSFREPSGEGTSEEGGAPGHAAGKSAPDERGASAVVIDEATSVSGAVGAGIVLLVAAAVGGVLARWRGGASAEESPRHTP